MMRTYITFAFFASMLAPNAGCIMLETEIPNVCVQESGLVIDVPLDDLDADDLALLGIDLPPDAAVVTQQLTAEQINSLPAVSLEESFTPDGLTDIPQTLDDLGVDASVRLLSVEVGGTADMFAGIERLAVTLRSTADVPAFEPLPLAVCDVSEGCDVSSDHLVLTTNTDDDLLPLLANDDVELVLALQARPTVPTYELDVDVCMAGDARWAVAP